MESHGLDSTLTAKPNKILIKIRARPTHERMYIRAQLHDTYILQNFSNVFSRFFLLRDLSTYKDFLKTRPQTF